MIGLDVTLLARATDAVQERMRTLGALGSRLLLPALAQYRDSADTTGEPPVHDVCAIVSIADPSVFDYTPALVQVETTGTLTSGMTVTDFSESVIPNAQVATAIDADRFWDTVLDAYGTVAAEVALPTAVTKAARLSSGSALAVRRISALGSAIAMIVSCAWTACSPTSTRSQ